MNKIHKIVLLPTTGDSKIARYQDNGGFLMGSIPLIKGQICYNNVDESWTSLWSPHHMYILSDDQIKEGDWKYNKRINQIWQHNREGKNLPDELKNYSGFDTFKVIASTDPKLNTAQECSENVVAWGKRCLPTIKNVFLKKFCELGGLSEACVEYIAAPDSSLRDEDGIYEPDLLIINDDNTITIYPKEEDDIKNQENYTRKEVEFLLRKYKKDIYSNLKIFTTGEKNPFHDEWFAKNLK